MHKKDKKRLSPVHKKGEVPSQARSLGSFSTTSVGTCISMEKLKRPVNI